MTYSEFGRRARQNASGGTDHGTAAPQFVMGGRVKGGLHGAYPSLTDLQDGDLKHTVDFRTRLRDRGAGLLGPAARLRRAPAAAARLIRLERSAR